MGESFPWGPSSTFLHLRDNHNSVLGIRQLAAQRGARSAAVEVAAFERELSSSSVMAAGAAGASMAALTLRLCGASSCFGGSGTSEGSSTASNDVSGGKQQTCHLFALPLESNMWGVRYDQGLVGAVQQGRLAVVAGDEQVGFCACGWVGEGGPLLCRALSPMLHFALAASLAFVWRLFGDEMNLFCCAHARTRSHWWAAARS